MPRAPLPPGQFHLGRFYHDGIGVDQDKELAFDWIKRAAAQGHPVAQTKLAQMLEVGDGCDEDLEQAEQWYLKAAEQQNPAALCNLGIVRSRGAKGEIAAARST